MFLGSNSISWSSKKQRVITRSFTEAEYCAITSMIDEIYWVCNLLKVLFLFLRVPPFIYYDNLGDIDVCAKLVFHFKMKHIEIDHHSIQNLCQQGLLHISHVLS